MASIEDALQEDALYVVNATRQGISPNRKRSENLAGALAGAEHRLAVYGSLAPGKENHHIVAPVGGRWSDGYTRGDLLDRGWASGMGYPGLRWRPDGPAVSVRILTATALPGHWRRLDDFEGREYRRILVPVFSELETALFCNLYELCAESN